MKAFSLSTPTPFPLNNFLPYSYNIFDSFSSFITCVCGPIPSTLQLLVIPINSRERQDSNELFLISTSGEGMKMNLSDEQFENECSPMKFTDGGIEISASFKHPANVKSDIALAYFGIEIFVNEEHQIILFDSENEGTVICFNDLQSSNESS